MMRFTREQLTSRDYDPIAVGLVDLADLRRRFEGRVWINHAAAIRGVLLKEGGPQLWIWDVVFCTMRWQPHMAMSGH